MVGLRAIWMCKRRRKRACEAGILWLSSEMQYRQTPGCSTSLVAVSYSIPFLFIWNGGCGGAWQPENPWELSLSDSITASLPETPSRPAQLLSLFLSLKAKTAQVPQGQILHKLYMKGLHFATEKTKAQRATELGLEYPCHNSGMMTAQENRLPSWPIGKQWRTQTQHS